MQERTILAVIGDRSHTLIVKSGLWREGFWRYFFRAFKSISATEIAMNLNLTWGDCVRIQKWSSPENPLLHSVAHAGQGPHPSDWRTG